MKIAPIDFINPSRRCCETPAKGDINGITGRYGKTICTFRLVLRGKIAWRNEIYGQYIIMILLRYLYMLLYLSNKILLLYPPSKFFVTIHIVRYVLLLIAYRALNFNFWTKSSLQCILFSRLFPIYRISLLEREIVVRPESSCVAFNALYERLTYIVNLIRAVQLNSCVM